MGTAVNAADVTSPQQIRSVRVIRFLEAFLPDPKICPASVKRYDPTAPSLTLSLSFSYNEFEKTSIIPLF